MSSEIKNVNPGDVSLKEKTIYIWIDILGFSNKLEEIGSYNDLIYELEDFQSIFNEDNFYSSIIVSDGILLIVYSPDRCEEIFEKIAIKQLKFILSSKNKSFIRGGIAVGVMNKKKELVSNGLAKAFKIEANQIDWPVVGTNEKNIKEIRELLSASENDNFGLLETCNKNGERIYFVDFILEENPDYFRLLVEKISSHTGEPNIKEKYVWLLRYYIQKFGQKRDFNFIKDSIEVLS